MMEAIRGLGSGVPWRFNGGALSAVQLFGRPAVIETHTL